MILGVDVGGTFTDVFFLDETNQRISVVKVPSTPMDPSVGFLEGLYTQSQFLAAVKTVVHVP